MQGSPFRVLIALLTALALTLGSLAGVSAVNGVPPDGFGFLEFCEDQIVDGALVDDVEVAFAEVFELPPDINLILFLCAEASFDAEVTVDGDVLVVDDDTGGGGGGSVIIGGNENSNSQDNDQEQTQEQTQDQDATQGNANGSSQGNANTGSAGGSVDSGCDASQDSDDDLGDDTVTCESGDASTGDVSVGDTNQANSGSQTGSNSNDQDGPQTGGSQANSPSNTTDQTVDADVSDIGGDNDDSVDNSIDGNTGTIDQSDDEGTIEGDDNEVGGAAALSTFLAQLIALLTVLLDDLFNPDEPLEPVITLSFEPANLASVPTGSERAMALAPAFETASISGSGVSGHAMMGVAPLPCRVTAQLTGFSPNTDYTLEIDVNGFIQPPESGMTDANGSATDVLNGVFFTNQVVRVSETNTGAMSGPQPVPPGCGGILP